MAERYPVMKERYGGPIRLIESELAVKYGSGKTIFIEHCNDLFAADVPDILIGRILAHCDEYPENTYVFQTKNPNRIIEYKYRLPQYKIIGTTIETNRWFESKAPCTDSRYINFRDLMREVQGQYFVTIEPIMDFDFSVLSAWMIYTRPSFVNIGADSKGSGLPEPSWEKVSALIEALKAAGIEIRQKSNLERLRN